MSAGGTPNKPNKSKSNTPADDVLIGEASEEQKTGWEKIANKANMGFEDSRKTGRVHEMQLLIDRGLAVMAFLCLCIALIAKQIEIDSMLESRTMLPRQS